MRQVRLGGIHTPRCGCEVTLTNGGRRRASCFVKIFWSMHGRMKPSIRHRSLKTYLSMPPLRTARSRRANSFNRAHVRSASTSCSTRRRRAFSRAYHTVSHHWACAAECICAGVRAEQDCLCACAHPPRTHVAFPPICTPTRLCSRGAVSHPPRSQKTTYNPTRADATYSKKCNVPAQPQRCQSPVVAQPASTAAIGLRR